MLNITLTHNETYSENPQPNSLRWRIMYKNEDGSFVDQAAAMKCKDFFNDVVAKVTGNKNFTKYYFDNSTIKSNEEGIYILLTGVNSPKTKFTPNIINVVNQRLGEELGYHLYLEVEDEKTMMLIPSKVWTSTYYISLLSLLIRGCNYNKTVQDWDHLFTILYDNEGYNNNATGCGYLKQEHCKILSEVGFRVEMAETNWYYSTEGSSEKPVEDCYLPSIVHDNGAVSWIRAGAVVVPEKEAAQ